MKIFNSKNKNDKRIKDIDNFNLETYSKLSDTKKVYVDIENLPLNTQYSDFGS